MAATSPRRARCLTAAWPVGGRADRQNLHAVLEEPAGGAAPTTTRAGPRWDSSRPPSPASRTPARRRRHQRDRRPGVRLKAAGVEAGDEVIVPAVTFVATATAVLQVGAVPVFVDVDPRTYTIDPGPWRAVTDAPAASPPWTTGAALRLRRPDRPRRRRGIPVVADCAHAHGSRWKGTGVGP